MDTPTPEANQSYIHTSAMILRGDKYARGTIIRRKCDGDGNVVDCANTNHILNSREC